MNDDASGEGIAILLILILLVLPIVFIRKVYRSERWTHATRAACVLTVAGAALLIQVYFRSRLSSAAGDLSLVRMWTDPSTTTDVINNQQVADAVAAVSAAHRAWLYSVVISTIITAWATLEWVIAVYVVLHRDSLRRAAQKSLPLYTLAAESAFRLMEDILGSWSRVQAQYEAAISTYDQNGDLSALLQAKHTFRVDAEECQEAIERYHDAERARLQIQRTANPLTDVLSELEEDWQEICAETGNIERLRTFVLDQWDLYRMARTAAPDAFPEEEFRSMKDEVYALDRNVEMVYERLIEADLLREEMLRSVAAFDALQVPKLYDRCLVCGRPLSDPESMVRGVGPTCWNRL